MAPGVQLTQRHNPEGLPTVSSVSFLDDVISADYEAAVAHALEHRVQWVDNQLTYDFLNEHAEHVSLFIQQWLPALPPLERLEAAEWASAQYVLALVHLEHSYGIGARLLLEAQQAATRQLAASFRDFEAMTDGPDAEVPASVARRLDHYAEQLDTMNFDDH